MVRPDDDGRSLFERILGTGCPTTRRYVVRRGERCAALLNAYPYTTGHLLVLPHRAVAELEELDADEAAELWAACTTRCAAVKAAYRPDGVNVGINLGRPPAPACPTTCTSTCCPAGRPTPTS